MRISDWSSDVCSSDLATHAAHHAAGRAVAHAAAHLLHDHAAHHAAVEHHVVAEGIGEIGLRQGIGRQCHRPVGSVVSEYGVVVGKIDQEVVETFIKAIDYADGAARLASKIQYDVGAHGRTEHDEAVLRGGIGKDRKSVV